MVRVHNYPNPGFLGDSSHSTIFHHVSSNTSTALSGGGTETTSRPPDHVAPPLFEQSLVEKGTHVLIGLVDLDITNLVQLVGFWQATGASLPLAENFVSHSSCAVANFVSSHASEPGGWASRNTELLFTNTQRPVIVHRDTRVTDYLSQMYDDNMRWESIGFFLAAACRAAFDIPFYPSLFTDDVQRRKLIRKLARLGDECLEVCLSLDCLNDLQLVLQYENFIVNSQVYGDQSM